MISIIIPTLNEEKRIEMTLGRLKENFTLPHEIIVSDGKSKDRTVELARKHIQKVVEFSGAHRQTIAEGRNDGARVADGDILVFMDADCIIVDQNTFFSTLLAMFSADPTLMAITTNLNPLAEEANFFDYAISFCTNKTYQFFNNVIHKGAALGEFQMMRRSAFDTLGGYNPKLVAGEDIDMFNRLSKIGRTYFSPHTAVYHSCRRAHSIGWPRLLFAWFMNTVWLTFFGRAYHKEWEPIR
jgi:glycosyltransferase involved in cell wall biosynthesis